MGESSPSEEQMAEWERQHEDVIDTLTLRAQELKWTRYDTELHLKNAGVPEPLARREAEKARPM